MSLDNFFVDVSNKESYEIQSDKEETPKQSHKSQSNKSQSKAPQLPVEERVKQYEEANQLCDQLFEKYQDDGWDTIWSTPAIAKLNNNVKEMFISNHSFMKLQQYFTTSGKTLDVFAPPQRSEILSQLNRTTFASNDNKVLEHLAHTYNDLVKSPFHQVQDMEFIGINDISTQYQLITISFPLYRDVHVRLGLANKLTPKEYIVWLKKYINYITPYLQDDGVMIILLKDFNQGKYIPILPFVPSLLRDTGLMWKYTAVVPTSAPLPKGLWIKFYHEKRFKINHGYLVGLAKQ